MKTRSKPGAVRRLAGACQGSLSVEFALAALPFLMLVMGIFEIGLMILQETVIFGALEEGARQLRTGVVQNDEDPETKFRDAVCGNLYGIMGCEDIVYDVRTFTDYGSVNLADLAAGDDGMPTDAAFDPGGAGEITTIRIYMNYKFNTPFLDKLFNTGTHGRLLTYTAVVKGEPWD